MEKVINVLKSIDIFGKPVELTFNNKTKHKTIYGAIITLLIILIGFVAMHFLF